MAFGGSVKPGLTMLPIYAGLGRRLLSIGCDDMLRCPSIRLLGFLRCDQVGGFAWHQNGKSLQALNHGMTCFV